MADVEPPAATNARGRSNGGRGSGRGHGSARALPVGDEEEEVIADDWLTGAEALRYCLHICGLDDYQIDALVRQGLVSLSSLRNESDIIHSLLVPNDPDQDRLKNIEALAYWVRDRRRGDWDCAMLKRCKKSALRDCLGHCGLDSGQRDAVIDEGINSLDSLGQMATPTCLNPNQLKNIEALAIWVRDKRRCRQPIVTEDWTAKNLPHNLCIPLGDLTQIKRFELFRDVIKHEDDIINHRLSWLFLSQSFFLLGFLTADVGDPGTNFAVRMVIGSFGFLATAFSIPLIRVVPDVAWTGDWRCKFWNRKELWWLGKLASMGLPILLLVLWATLLGIVAKRRDQVTQP